MLKLTKVWSLVLAAVMTLSLALACPAPASAASYDLSDMLKYFNITYSDSLSDSTIIGTESFNLTVTATVTCNQTLDFPFNLITAVKMSGHVIGQINSTQTPIELNPGYTLSITDFPRTKGASYSDTRSVALVFPGGSPDGKYTVKGEPGKKGGVWIKIGNQNYWQNVTSSLPANYLTPQDFGTVNYYSYALNITSAHGTVTRTPSYDTASAPNPHPYKSGDTVSLTPKSDPGYTFSGWSGDLTGSANPATIIMNSDKCVTASYTQDEYTLTVNSAHGTITRVPYQATYHYGDSVQLNVVADPGWTFSGWSGADGTCGTTATVVMKSSRIITANFTQNNYLLTTGVSPSSTSGNVTGGSSYHYNDPATLHATANPGWRFTGWSGDLSGTTNPATVTIDRSKSITANFTLNEYTLSVAGEHGAVTRNPDKPAYHYGDIIQLGVTPDPGYTFSGWGSSLSGLVNPVNITVQGNMNINASFVLSQYSLTAQSSPAGASSFIISSGPYTHNVPVTVTANVSDGYTFNNWISSDLGVSFDASANPLTFNMPDNNVIVTANCTQNKYNLIAEASPAGSGNFFFNSPGPYFYDNTATVTANASPGYRFVNWIGDVSSSSNPLNVTINKNKKITANFERIPYFLTVGASSGSGGDFSFTQEPPYYYGESVTVTANASTGYYFSGWSDLNSADGASGDTATVVITGNRTLSANFLPNNYVLTADVSPADSGSISGSGSYQYQDPVSLNATPAEGWAFSGWSSPDDSISISSNATAPPAFSMPAQPGRIVANFIRLKGDLEIDINLEGRSSVGSHFILPLEVWLHAPGVVFSPETALYTFPANTDDQGKLTLTGIGTGTYDVRVKGPSTLRNKKADVTISANGTESINLGALIGGDVDGDNQIGDSDFEALIPFYGVTVSEPPGPEAACDLNGDGEVNMLDYTLLVNNYGQIGAP